MLTRLAMMLTVATFQGSIRWMSNIGRLRKRREVLSINDGWRADRVLAGMALLRPEVAARYRVNEEGNGESK